MAAGTQVARARQLPCPTSLARRDRRYELVEGKLRNMNSRVGRIVLVVVGVILLLVGAVFAGQGANLIPGSGMSGERMWLYIGVFVAIVGIVLIVLGLRRRGRGDTDS
jgi:uncharacterized Tic20 family protein